MQRQIDQKRSIEFLNNDCFRMQIDVHENFMTSMCSMTMHSLRFVMLFIVLIVSMLIKTSMSKQRRCISERWMKRRKREALIISLLSTLFIIWTFFTDIKTSMSKRRRCFSERWMKRRKHKTRIISRLLTLSTTWIFFIWIKTSMLKRRRCIKER